MKKFAVKLLLLSTPFVVIFGFPALVLFLSGEFSSLEAIVARQSNSRSEMLVGMAYSNPASTYKVHTCQVRRPEVVALGTSRVLQFRRGFFNNESNFYNAGHAVGHVYQYESFLDQTEKDSRLKLIVLGFDQWNVIYQRGGDTLSQNKSLPSAVTPMSVLRERYSKIYGDYWEGKFTLAQLNPINNANLIGVQAITKKSGYRRDGSYRYYGESPDRASGYQQTIERVKRRDALFVGDPAFEKRLPALLDFLDECKRRKIHVVMFLPPYAGVVYDAIQGESKSEYLDKLPARLRPLLESRGFSFFDFSHPSFAESDDTECIDGIHGGEKMYLRMLVKMSAADAVLRKHVKPEAELTALLNQSTDPVAVFKN